MTTYTLDNTNLEASRQAAQSAYGTLPALPADTPATDELEALHHLLWGDLDVDEVADYVQYLADVRAGRAHLFDC